MTGYIFWIKLLLFSPIIDKSSRYGIENILINKKDGLTSREKKSRAEQNKAWPSPFSRFTLPLSMIENPISAQIYSRVKLMSITHLIIIGIKIFFLKRI